MPANPDRPAELTLADLIKDQPLREADWNIPLHPVYAELGWFGPDYSDLFRPKNEHPLAELARGVRSKLEDLDELLTTPGGYPIGRAAGRITLAALVAGPAIFGAASYLSDNFAFANTLTPGDGFNPMEPNQDQPVTGIAVIIPAEASQNEDATAQAPIVEVSPILEPVLPELPPDAILSPWPTEITNAMNRLVLPDNVRLVRSPNTPPGQPNCVTACYLQNTYEVYIVTPPPDTYPELFRMVYELGHAHQQKRREMEGKTTWEETTEYQAFLVTLNKVNAILRQRGDAEWTQEPYHLFTNIWTGYIIGDPAFTNKPSNWSSMLINPYSQQLIDWKNYMDNWVRK